MDAPRDFARPRNDHARWRGFGRGASSSSESSSESALKKESPLLDSEMDWSPFRLPFGPEAIAALIDLAVKAREAAASNCAASKDFWSCAYLRVGPRRVASRETSMRPRRAPGGDQRVSRTLPRRAPRDAALYRFSCARFAASAFFNSRAAESFARASRSAVPRLSSAARRAASA